MLLVTGRPDSTLGTQRSLGHRRTEPFLTRAEYSGATEAKLSVSQKSYGKLTLPPAGQSVSERQCQTAECHDLVEGLLTF